MNMPNLRIAVLINAAGDVVRSRLMPVNKINPLVDLKKALLSLPLSGDGVIFIEYVLIAGVKDSPEMAHKLADYPRGLQYVVSGCKTPMTAAGTLPVADAWGKSSLLAFFQ